MLAQDISHSLLRVGSGLRAHLLEVWHLLRGPVGRDNGVTIPRAGDRPSMGTLLTRPGRIGRVTLVGAGPGDPDNLTLGAVRALESADIILYDDLVPAEILSFACREAVCIPVGKRCGKARCVQADINRLMTDLARTGGHLVRLKSGDPSLFGRAGEELAHLADQGIDVAVVPGVTAASAMAADLGISLTHRACAHSVTFVTGHAKTGGLPDDVNWAALADPRATVVFYMGRGNAAAISHRLREHGLPPDTPAVAIAAAGRNGRQWLRSRLSDLACAAAELPAAEPVLIGIGHVFEQARIGSERTGASLRGTRSMERRSVHPHS